MKKVLAVDDDPVIRNLIAALLRRKGFLVSQAANGEEAITLLSNSRTDGGQTEFDLILLDLMMPKVSGWDVLVYIEQSMPEMLKHVAVISAAGEAQLRDLETRSACRVVLSKPFDAEEFYAKVASCIRGPYDPNQFNSDDPGAPNHFQCLIALPLLLPIVWQLLV